MGQQNPDRGLEGLRRTGENRLRDTEEKLQEFLAGITKAKVRKVARHYQQLADSYGHRRRCQHSSD